MIINPLTLLNNTEFNDKVSYSFKNMTASSTSSITSSINNNNERPPGSRKRNDQDVTYKRNKKDKNSKWGNLVSTERLSQWSELLPKGRTTSNPSQVTASMSSVLSQIRRFSGSDEQPINIEFDKKTECKDISKDKGNDIKINLKEDDISAHPLGQPSETQHIENVPVVKYMHMEDLVLDDVWTPIDIIEHIAPIYSRSTEIQSTESSISNNNIVLSKERPRKPDFSGDINYELESWPSSDQLAQLSNIPLTKILLPNRRTRQKTTNPNFLKLYAMETQSRKNNLLPEIYIDDQTLQSLTYPTLQRLNFANDIKLAIMTRKKLWVDMSLGSTRQDLFGDVTPWNLKFTPTKATLDVPSESASQHESLVRVHSDVKPWIGVKDSSETMLNPCGKLKLGHNRELQYVVKGWCDTRFDSHTT